MMAGRTLVLTHLLALGFVAVALIAVHSFAQVGGSGSSTERAPQIAVSASVLDFGPVRVQGKKDLTLRVWNTGGGVLSGTATCTAPFAIKDAAYSLKSGVSKSLTVRYQPSAPGTNAGAIILSGAGRVQVLLTGRAGVPPQPPQRVRFVTPEEVDRADFIVRYSDDRTSYVVKPATQEAVPRHIFYEPLTSAEVVKLAAAQPRHELAIIVLPRFRGRSADAGVAPKPEAGRGTDWLKNLEAFVKDLRKAGYQSLVFCEGGTKVGKVAGLRVVEGPQVATALTGG